MTPRSSCPPMPVFLPYPGLSAFGCTGKDNSMVLRPDPIRLELMKNAFAAIADEMAATVIRTARSSVIKEAMDFSTGLLDPEGNLIAQGLCLPVHMGSFPPTLATVLEKFGEQMRP